MGTIHAGSPRTWAAGPIPRTQGIVSMLALLAAIASLSPMQGLAAQAVYSIVPCTMSLELHGIPSVAGTPFETTREICRGRGVFELPANGATDAAAATKSPLVAWVRSDGRLDVRVELRDGPAARVYEGKRIAPGTKRTTLRRVGHSGGPDLSASLRSVSGSVAVSIDVVDANPRRIVRDLARIGNLKLRHVERIMETPIKLDFQVVPVETVLDLLAFESGAVLHRDGPGGYLFGLNPHAAEIEALRSEAHGLSIDGDGMALKRVLQRIVELSAPAVEGEPGPPVGDELEALARMAMDDDEPAAAEGYQRARLLEIERREYGVHRPEYALASADLARARLAQGDRREAQSLFERALAILSTSDLGDQLDRARVLGELGNLALDAGRIEDAVDHADRAWKIVVGTSTEVAKAQSLAMLRVRRSLERLEAGLGRVFMERDEHAVADMHLERALVLAEALWGAGDKLTAGPRQQLTMNAWRMGDPGRAGKIHLDSLRAAQAAGDTHSAVRVGALGNLAAIRVGEGNTKEAVEFGSRYLKAVEATNAITSLRTQSAQRFVVLLLRLDRQFDAADGLEHLLPPEIPGLSRPFDMAEMFDAHLGMLLAAHFDRLLLTQTHAMKEWTSRAALQESAAWAHAFAGDGIRAMERLSEALATLRQLNGPDDAQTLRVAKQLQAWRELAGAPDGAARMPDRR